MDVAPIVLLGSVIFTLLNFVKSVRGALSGGSANAAVTQLTAYVVGIAVIFIAGTASMMGSVTVNGVALVDLSAGDKVLVGLVASSLFGVVHEVVKAVDGTQSAAKPTLLNDPPPQD